MASNPPERTAHWARLLSARPPAVLACTRNALGRACERPDHVDANALADVVLRDPLMALRLLTFVTQQLGPRLSRPVETVTAGLVLLGVEPFFRAFKDLETIEERLAGRPEALAGAMALVARSHRAARLAAAFAVHRQDDSAEALHQAALLTQFSGLLLWCEAPDAAMDIAARQAADPRQRSVDAQRTILGVELAAVEAALMAQWGLPTLLCELMQPGLPGPPGPRAVRLAVRIARHSQSSWDDPALAQDYAELGSLLNLPAQAAQALVREVEGD